VADEKGRPIRPQALEGGGPPLDLLAVGTLARAVRDRTDGAAVRLQLRDGDLQRIVDQRVGRQPAALLQRTQRRRADGPLTRG
jgi:hypothetical protein